MKAIRTEKLLVKSFVISKKKIYIFSFILFALTVLVNILFSTFKEDIRCWQINRNLPAKYRVCSVQFKGADLPLINSNISFQEDGMVIISDSIENLRNESYLIMLFDLNKFSGEFKEIKEDCLLDSEYAENKNTGFFLYRCNLKNDINLYARTSLSELENNKNQVAAIIKNYKDK